jgi:PAT family beta-lactamase induction signal transducer AmpG
MFGLGFSSGIPFMLVGNTLGFWLRESGITLTTIGFLSWVGLAYSFKFLWAPLTDKFDVPIFGKTLGRRRGWMLFSQVVVMAALIGMSILKPEGGVAMFTLLAAIAACASATQDIVIDAWRIEASESAEDMALLSSTYQLGYRGALLITDSIILIVAGSVGWAISYSLMGVLMSVGLVATLLAPEPVRHFVTHEVPKVAWSLRGILISIFEPLLVFLKDHGQKALLILAAVSFYRLADFVMGPMANPFYSDLGLSVGVVGGVRGTVGLFASIAGIAAGGLCAVRFGLLKTLVLGALLGPLSNLAFSAMAFMGPNNAMFALAMGIDNFSGGFAGVALVGYMSTLTSVGYTATQYALLTSFYTLLGKLLKGFSGAIVDSLSHQFGLMESYAIFFAGTAVIGVPAVICCIFLAAWGIKPIAK